MATPLGMEAQGKLPPPKMPCTHIWEIESPHGGPTSKGVCRLCKVEKDFANALPSDPESYKKIVLKGSKPKPRKGVEEMPKGGQNRPRSKELAPLKEKALQLFREGKATKEVRAMPEFAEVPESTFATWKLSVSKESTAVRTPKRKASGRDAHERSTGQTGQPDVLAAGPQPPRGGTLLDFLTRLEPTLAAPQERLSTPQPADQIGELLVGVGLVLVGSWLKRMEAPTDAH